MSSNCNNHSNNLKNIYFLLPALGLAAFCIAMNSVGYLGGDGDDWQYLKAARCIAENLFCVPETHWSARLPMTYGLAGTIAVFGESRESLWILPGLASFAGIVAFGLLVARHLGQKAALFASFLLVATPTFGRDLVSLNIGLLEFGFLAVALLVLDIGSQHERRGLLLLAGIVFGMAAMTRATTFVALPLACAALWLGKRQTSLVYFLVGLILLLLAEAFFYWAVTGNPFHGWMLSLNHVRLYSSELSPAVDTTQSALFNPDYIAGWSRPEGIQIHWTVDGILNLVASPIVGPLLVTTFVLCLFDRRRFGRAHAFLLAAGLFYMFGLIYGLAIHPVPRMFFPSIAAFAGLSGLILAQRWERGDHALPVLVSAGLGGVALLVSYMGFQFGGIEPLAEKWAGQRGGKVAIAEHSRRVFALRPALYSLPKASETDVNTALVLSIGQCPKLLSEAPGTQWSVLRAQKFPGRFTQTGYILCEIRKVSANPAASPHR